MFQCFSLIFSRQASNMNVLSLIKSAGEHCVCRADQVSWRANPPGQPLHLHTHFGQLRGPRDWLRVRRECRRLPRHRRDHSAVPLPRSHAWLDFFSIFFPFFHSSPNFSSIFPFFSIFFSIFRTIALFFDSSPIFSSIFIKILEKFFFDKFLIKIISTSLCFVYVRRARVDLSHWRLEPGLYTTRDLHWQNSFPLSYRQRSGEKIWLEISVVFLPYSHQFAVKFHHFFF